MKFWFRTGIKSLLLIALAGSSLTFAAPADDLGRLLLATDGVITEFEQTVTDVHGRLLEKSHGDLHISKPLVLWRVQSPFPQTILLRETSLQIYDPDLEQVTERDFGEEWSQVPLAVLTRANVDLSQAFSVTAGTNDSSELNAAGFFVLRPLSQEALFEEITMRFVDQRLESLSILDPTGQVTLVELKNYRSGQVIQSDVFELKVPAGTEFVKG